MRTRLIDLNGRLWRCTEVSPGEEAGVIPNAVAHVVAEDPAEVSVTLVTPRATYAVSGQMDSDGRLALTPDARRQITEAGLIGYLMTLDHQRELELAHEEQQ